jgi:predicted Zn-dependent protease
MIRRLRVFALCRAAILLALLCSTGNGQSKSAPKADANPASPKKPATGNNKPTRDASNATERDDARAIRSVIKRLIEAVHSKDPSAVAEAFDTSRLFREIERQQVLVGMKSAERAAMRMSLASSFNESLVREFAENGWNRFGVHSVNVNEKHSEATAIVRMLDAKGRLAATVQFWLADIDGHWKVYDWEDSESIMRMSTHIGALTAVLRGQRGSEDIQRLLAAAQQSSSGLPENAEQLLDESSGFAMPDVLEGARMLLYTQTRFAAGDPVKAEKCLAAASTLHSDMLVGAKIRAEICAAQGDFAKSLEHARSALTQLGDDPNTFARIGDCLVKLNNFPEAAKAYRKGLDSDPDSTRNLLGLASALPAGQKKELAQRFGRLDDPPSGAEQIAAGLQEAEDAEGLEVLLDEYEKQGIDPKQIEYYRAVTSSLRRQFDEAAERFRQLRDQTENPEQKSFYEDRLIGVLLSAGKPVEAYRQAIDKSVALQSIIEQLLREEKSNDILPVTDLYIKEFPRESRPYLYRGNAHFLKKEYEQAEKELVNGAALAESEEVREQFRKFRVVTRYRMGQPIAAYEDIPPRAVAFRQVADLLWRDGKGQDLQRLVALHRKDDSENPSLDVWEAEAKLLQKDYASALKLLAEAVKQNDRPDVKGRLFDRILDVHLAAGDPLKGYTEAPDADHAFAYLAAHLIQKEDAKLLLALVGAHRDKSTNSGGAAQGDGASALLDYYEGRAHFMDKDYAAAEPFLSAAVSQADGDLADASREFSVLALIRLGKTVETYTQAEAKDEAFVELARLLAREKNAADLKALVAARTKDSPTDPALPLWEAEAYWIGNDYPKVIEALSGQGAAVPSEQPDRSRFEDRLVRSLTRVKRFEDARREAHTSTLRDGDPWFEAVVVVAAGQPEQAATLLRKCLERGYSLEDFYADTDLGMGLRSKLLGKLRDEFPEPAALQAGGEQAANSSGSSP